VLTATPANTEASIIAPQTSKTVCLRQGTLNLSSGELRVAKNAENNKGNSIGESLQFTVKKGKLTMLHFQLVHCLHPRLHLPSPSQVTQLTKPRRRSCMHPML
jgi:hypothetical protein